MGKNGLFTADELAARHSLSAKTIDDYAAAGLLHPVKIQGQTLFTAGAFTRLEVIEKGRKLGFSLEEIRQIMTSVRRTTYEKPSGSA